MALLNSSKSSRTVLHGFSRLYFHDQIAKSTWANGVFPHRFSSKPDLHAPFCRIPFRNHGGNNPSLGFSYFHSLGSEIASKPSKKSLTFSPLSEKLSPREFFRFYSHEPTQRGFSLIGSSGSTKKVVPSIRLQQFSSEAQRKFFSFMRSSEPGKVFSREFSKLLARPLEAVRSTFSGYREATALHIEAFWKRNYLVLVGAVGVGLCLLLWRIMFGVANMFVGLSEGMAKYGFLALASAIVAFTGIYVRSRFTVNPDRVYRMAMRRLNTSAGILEVMGAPLSGTDVRAYVMSGGGLRIKNFKPRLSSKRCFLIFPISGSERKGLVSVEVKKKKGQYDMRLLAVDIPVTTGADQRLFLVGNEEEYKIGGGLIYELRDPIIKAMAAEKEFEDIDQKEEEEEAERELQEEERKRQEEIEKLERGSS
ncbi:hypothetical protein EJ110_NYTH24452 [Nymphaea thermarum]|nr:hypothetical protein EJ110_NYTH24452 [Nymphaea thermarum]